MSSGKTGSRRVGDGEEKIELDCNVQPDGIAFARRTRNFTKGITTSTTHTSTRTSTRTSTHPPHRLLVCEPRCCEPAYPVLFATDIAARGIHVDDVELVVHVDPPAEHKAYLHRSGRTARAGASGVVVTLQTSDQAADVTAMTRKAGISVTARRAVPGAPRLLELTGSRAAHVTPIAEAPTPARPRTSGATG